MLDRWRDLDHGQQRVLAVLGSLVVVIGLVAALVAVIDPGSSKDAVRTEGASSTSSSEITTTTASDGSATSTSTSRSSTGSAARSTTTTVRGGSTTTIKASGSSKGTTPTTAKGATTTTTSRAATSTTAPTVYVVGACNPGGGGADAKTIANDLCADRAAQGLPKLARNSGLDAEATQWAQTMAANGALSHNPSYSASVRADCSRCVGWAENVAYGSTAASAWSALMASRCHVANNRYGSAGEYGVGTFTSGGFVWVVQDFGFYDGSPAPCTD